MSTATAVIRNGMQDGDILMLYLWWKRMVWQAGAGVELSIPLWMLRSNPLASCYIQRLGRDLDLALGVRWIDSPLSPRSKSVLMRCVGKGWEAKTLSDLARVRHHGWIRGIGDATKADINRVLKHTIEQAAPRPTMETRL